MPAQAKLGRGTLVDSDGAARLGHPPPTVRFAVGRLGHPPENGRIQVAGSVESFVRETAARIIVQPITPEIAALAVQLPAGFPKDPADRLIAATAMVEGAPLVTADERIRLARVVRTIW